MAGFAAGLLAAFLATGLLAGAFTAVFLTGAFFATAFFAAGFAAGFAVTAFFAGAVFLATAFLGVVFFTEAFLAGAFLAAGLVAVFFTAAFLAAVLAGAFLAAGFAVTFFAAAFFRPARFRGGLGCRIGTSLIGLALIRGGSRIELQCELHGGIKEAFYSGEGNVEHFGLAVEAEADLKGALGDLEVPILVLQHDGHFLVVLLEQFFADARAGRTRGKGNEEMMLAGQAGPRHFGQNLAHDAAQGFLSENVVSHVVFGHSALISS